MNIKNSKIKNNNLQKPLPNTVTIYLFIFLQIVRSFSFFLFMFHQTFSNNIKPDKKTLHKFCFKGAPRTKINARDYTAEWCWKNDPKKKKN